MCRQRGPRCLAAFCDAIQSLVILRRHVSAAAFVVDTTHLIFQVNPFRHRHDARSRRPIVSSWSEYRTRQKAIVGEKNAYFSSPDLELHKLLRKLRPSTSYLLTYPESSQIQRQSALGVWTRMHNIHDRRTSSSRCRLVISLL